MFILAMILLHGQIYYNVNIQGLINNVLCIGTCQRTIKLSSSKIIPSDYNVTHHWYQTTNWLINESKQIPKLSNEHTLQCFWVNLSSGSKILFVKHVQTFICSSTMEAPTGCKKWQAELQISSYIQQMTVLLNDHLRS